MAYLSALSAVCRSPRAQNAVRGTRRRCRSVGLKVTVEGDAAEVGELSKGGGVAGFALSTVVARETGEGTGLTEGKGLVVVLIGLETAVVAQVCGLVVNEVIVGTLVVGEESVGVGAECVR